MQRRRMHCAATYDPTGGPIQGGGVFTCNPLSHRSLNNTDSSPGTPAVAWRLPDISPALMHGSRRALVPDPASPALHRTRAIVSAPVFIAELGGS